jgi:sulfide:quinone oxidoreductase
VVVDSGLTNDKYAWVQVNKQTLETSFPRVWAVGDVNGIGTPKAGVFAEGGARVVAAEIIAHIRGDAAPAPYRGLGSCYLEFGSGEVARVDVEFLAGPHPTGTYQAPSLALRAEKDAFSSTRVARWFSRGSSR